METITNACTTNAHLTQWVDEMAALCKPERIEWIDGSDEEAARLTRQAIEEKILIELNQEKLPGCYLHRSNPNDVARVEKLTFICTEREEDAGPTNNWMAPAEAYRKLGGLFEGAMRGRTMYVIPYVMGALGSPFSKVGVELTDSVYVVLNMRLMTRAGSAALAQLGDSPDFVKGLHSVAECDPEKRFICHFPQDSTIWSVGSGYGGNALLGKKCFALRLGSALGRREGWLAEHMLILGLENPQGEVTYVAAAFPSACGKTNLAMLVPPENFPGWKVWTVGDDIAWMRVGDDGRLWASNPEAGFFGVAPGTSRSSNYNAMKTITHDTIFTNVLQTADNTVWWEGMSGEPPTHGLDWKGTPWTPESAKGEKGAHPNARFTVRASQCPSISPRWEDPQGVPISAILFGGRRARLQPLVYEAFDWAHGVYLGAMMSSETTAAAIGAVGVVRRDPMAMLPFCGYHMGDYFAHWLDMGTRLTNPPRVFHVNWFRTDDGGKFLWPGYGQNLRVLKWVAERCAGTGQAVEQPIGWLPTPDAIDLGGLALSSEQLERLLAVDRGEWLAELESQQELFTLLGDRMPAGVAEQREALRARLG
ncbi:MAG: phosphoenolpyruvate carboxykinase (GTP) [Proteobacteria bacterium]|nr:phosphoenolpyruvate carboxykinase (GTP) [Pseudomonadota bacterium]